MFQRVEACCRPARIWIGATSAAIPHSPWKTSRGGPARWESRSKCRRDRADHQRGSQIRRHTIWTRRWGTTVEDSPQIGRNELAGCVDDVAGRGLHPGIGDRIQNAEISVRPPPSAWEEMQPMPTRSEGRQHDAEKPASRKTRSNLVGHQRADHRAGLSENADQLVPNW